MTVYFNHARTQFESRIGRICRLLAAFGRFARRLAGTADRIWWRRCVRANAGLIMGCAAGVFLCGCNRPGAIDVDLTSHPVRFLIDHRGWPRPFMCPRVTEFAVASDEEGAVWQLAAESAEGVPARELAIVYGELPRGFVQTVPTSGRPPRLMEGRTYYVGAGGPRSVYRIVFALPLERGMPLPQGSR
ncbi:hypothetical protein RAS2_01010 [Phycisphaerae bacterium RAS2]|nr:hypothetical protein RAS2_01010 [Phycisphaerae bacterium RAS2]